MPGIGLNHTSDVKDHDDLSTRCMKDRADTLEQGAFVVREVEIQGRAVVPFAGKTSE